MTRPRIPCQVPGCKRHVTPQKIMVAYGYAVIATEGICAVHWRLVPLAYRRVYRRATQALVNTQDKGNYDVWNRLWNRCRRAAIERSMGL